MLTASQRSYRYLDGPTLNFPDVDAPWGAVLLLIGPSGCGKSTWLALAAALVAPAAGMLTVAGQNLNALKFIASDK